MPEPGRSALLCELIALEVAYRRLHNETPTAAEYGARFPALDPARLAAELEVPTPPNTPAIPRPEDEPQVLRTEARRIRCPHCHNVMVLVDERPDEVLCPGCGSTFRIHDARPTASPVPAKPLGKFELLERVGVGAFGAVWKARDTTLDRVVALKIPHSGLLTSGDEMVRFQREAKAAAQLRHPGHAAFSNGRKGKALEDAKDKKIEQLEAKLQKKNEVMAELMEAHTELKKQSPALLMGSRCVPLFEFS